ncbi:MAG: hypothetical protein OXD32_06205 [Endozoicomonadaceae bacterium]|nr:hypothetical protein [Endozoicomonadaceae bacterium]
MRIDIDERDKTAHVNIENFDINNDQETIQEYTGRVAEKPPSSNQSQILASSHSYTSCLQNSQKIVTLGLSQQNENTDNLKYNDYVKQGILVNSSPAYSTLASHCTITVDNTITLSNDQQTELQEPLERNIADYSEYSINVPFRKLMRKINLPHNEGGMCWPLAQKACQHCTLGMGVKHMKIMESMYELSENEESLSDAKRYEALAFLDEVAISGVSHGSCLPYAVIRAMKGCYKGTPDGPRWKKESENEQVCVKEKMSLTQFSYDGIQEFLQKIKDDNGNKS